MERKPLTSDDIMALVGISDEDKALIDATVDELSGEDESKAALALRGFLASQFIELEPDDAMRDEIDGTAAAFWDGWVWCKELG